MAVTNVDIFGRKTFFIASQKSDILEEALEHFCALGYEAHVVEDDNTVPMQEKVSRIIEKCPDSILFFNVDANIHGINWNDYIKNLQYNHSQDALFGVLHHKGKEDQDNQIDNLYTRNIGVRAGCILLQENADANFNHILKVLQDLGAKGRRNFIRAKCDARSSLTFEHDGQKYHAQILDVNIANVGCDVQGDIKKLKIYSKAQNAEFNINGLQFNSDIVLIMKREKAGLNNVIFMFTHDWPDDLPDLDDKTTNILNKKIFSIITSETKNICERN